MPKVSERKSSAAVEKVRNRRAESRRPSRSAAPKLKDVRRQEDQEDLAKTPVKGEKNENYDDCPMVTGSWLDYTEDTIWIDSDSDEEEVMLRKNFFLPYSDHNYDPMDPEDRVNHPHEGPFPTSDGLEADGRLHVSYPPKATDQVDLSYNCEQMTSSRIPEKKDDVVKRSSRGIKRKLSQDEDEQMTAQERKKLAE